MNFCKPTLENPFRSRRTAVKTKTIDIRLSPEELERIKLQAAKYQMGVSTYLRALALDESFRRAHDGYVGHLSAKLQGLRGLHKTGA